MAPISRGFLSESVTGGTRRAGERERAQQRARRCSAGPDPALGISDPSPAVTTCTARRRPSGGGNIGTLPRRRAHVSGSRSTRRRSGPGRPFGFTQVMLTDVSSKRHYQRTTPFVTLAFDGNNWAEARPWPSRGRYGWGDPSKPFTAIESSTPAGYTSAPKSRSRRGGGILASRSPRRRRTESSRRFALVPGLGYTSLPEITITGGGGSGRDGRRAFHSYVNHGRRVGADRPRTWR